MKRNIIPAGTVLILCSANSFAQSEAYKAGYSVGHQIGRFVGQALPAICVLSVITVAFLGYRAWRKRRAIRSGQV